MSDAPNPYAPPTVDELPPSPAQSFGYEPTAALAITLRVLLAIAVGALLINAGTLAMQLDLLGRVASGEGVSYGEAVASDRRVQLASGMFLLALLATAVTWCIWQSRTSENVRSLDGPPMRFGPKAWGWFFCPIVNLWRPLAVITELWESAPLTPASKVGAIAGKPAPPTWLAAGWWLPWIIGGMLSRLSERMAGDGSDIDELINATNFGIVACALLAISGMFAIVLITTLQKRVEARFAALQVKGRS